MKAHLLLALLAVACGSSDDLEFDTAGNTWFETDVYGHRALEKSSSGALDIDETEVGALVITELMADTNAVTDIKGEWLELQNTTEDSIDLKGLWIISGSVGLTTQVYVGTDYVVGPMGSVVFGRNIDTNTNGGVPIDYSSSSFKLPNTDTALAMTAIGRNLDLLSYSTPIPGKSVALDPTASDSNNDGPEMWCAGTSIYGSGDLGSPGDANPSCPGIGTDADGDGYSVEAGDCDDFDSEVNPGMDDPVEDALDTDCSALTTSDFLRMFYNSDDFTRPVINEVMGDPKKSADAYGEWIEVLNTTTFELDMKGFMIANPATVSYPDAHITERHVVAPGDTFLIGRSSNSSLNGGVSVEAEATAMRLTNSSDALALYAGGVELDEVAWTAGMMANGAAWSLDPSAADFYSNDDPSAWCTASASFGKGDYGTPGASNPSCP